MMKRCALIACRVFAIAQTLIISMHMLQAICTQIRKSNRTQTTREIAYENHSIQYLVVVMTRIETEHSRV